MTVFNLTKIWEQNISNNLKKKLKPEKERKNINDKIIQAGFKFEKSPEIKIVKDLKTLKSVETYGNLPDISFTKDEQKVINDIKVGIEKRGGYDGNQLLIKGMLYDDDKNTVYLEARRAKYSLLRALGLKKFDENSKLYQLTLYKTGVLIPQVSKDKDVVFVERARDKFYSMAGGFMEAKENKQSLNGMALKTAKNELQEEFLSDIENKDRDTFLKQFAGNLDIKGVSVRQTVGGIGTIEFVVENKIDLDTKYLKFIIENNKAKDKKEHSGNNFVVPLDSSKRAIAITKITENYHNIPCLERKEESGWFLYSSALNIMENKNLSSLLLKKPSDFVNMTSLKNPPLKSISWVKKEEKKIIKKNTKTQKSI